MAKVLITGSTGMVGKGVLLECLADDSIDSIILLNRSSIDIQNPKIKEILLKDFTQLNAVKDQLGNLDGCFHCMGVTSVGMNEEQYSGLTFDITKELADVCYDLNPDMTFNYVSGTGTDSSEKGKSMWAHVKGKTENYILNRGFKKALMFRPGFIIPEKGIKSKTRLYNIGLIIMRPFFPLFRNSPNVTSTTKLGRAMINSLSKTPNTLHLENREINELAEL